MNYKSKIPFLLFLFMTSFFLNTNNALAKTIQLKYSNNKKELSSKNEFINQVGDTLETRFIPPKGFKRIGADKDSFAHFLRSYGLKPHGSSVFLYNGQKKKNQNAHMAVFKLPIENYDLQQCSDSIMRMKGEYYYSKKEYLKIKFPLGGGFFADFYKWQSGYGLSLANSKYQWIKNTKNNDSYESFKKFMRFVFAYSGTMHLDETSKPINSSIIEIGDIFVKGGSPGHAVMIVDICQNQYGHKAFLLAQGYMPAQEFHILKNPLHGECPWYYQQEINYPFYTPEYTFSRDCLKRPCF